MSRFVCPCLVVSVLCCHLSVVPGVSVILGVSQVLGGWNPAMPAWRCFSWGFHPQLGMCVEDLPWLVLAFCASFGLWAAAGQGGCCPNSQPPWAVALWTSYCLVWDISPIFVLEFGTGTAMILLQSPESSSRFFFFFFGQFLPSRRMPLQAPALQGPCLPTLKQGRNSQGQGNNNSLYHSRAPALVRRQFLPPFPSSRSKEGARPWAGGSKIVFSPCHVQWQLSLCDLPIFNIAPGLGWLRFSGEEALAGLCDRERWSDVGFEHDGWKCEMDTVREGCWKRSDTWKGFWRALVWVQLQREHPSSSFHSLPPGCGDGQSQVASGYLCWLGSGGAPPAFRNLLSFLFLPSSKQTKGLGVSCCCRLLIF